MVTDLHLSPNHNPPYVPPDNPTAGLPWISRKTPAYHRVTPQVKRLCFGAGKFVAVGLGGVRKSKDFADPGWNIEVGQVMYSVDGINWTAAETPGASGSFLDVTYGNGLFVAVGDAINVPIMTSPDGVEWTKRSAPVERPWVGVAYGHGLWVALARFTDHPLPVFEALLGSPSYELEKAQYLAENPPEAACGAIYSYDAEHWFRIADGSLMANDGIGQPEVLWASIAYGPRPGDLPGHFMAISDTSYRCASLDRRRFGDSQDTNPTFPTEVHNRQNAWDVNGVGRIEGVRGNRVVFNPMDHKFTTVRHGASIPYNNLFGSNLMNGQGYASGAPHIAHSWELHSSWLEPVSVPPIPLFFWDPLLTPEDGIGWSDIAVSTDTGTLVAVQPITAPQPFRAHKDIFQVLIDALRGVEDPATDSPFRWYIPTLVRKEKNWPPNPANFGTGPLGSVGLMPISDITARRGYGAIAYGNGRFVALESEPPRPVNPDELPAYLVGTSLFDIPTNNVTSFVSTDDGKNWVYNVIDGSTDWTSVAFGKNATIERSGIAGPPDLGLHVRVRCSALWDVASDVGSEIRKVVRAQWDLVVSSAIEYSVTVDDPGDDGGIFVAVSSHNSPDPIMWSRNGIAWNRSYVSGTDALESQWFDVQWGGQGDDGKFIALGNTTEGHQFLGGPLPTIMSSPDGISWSDPQTFTLDGLIPGAGVQGQRLMFRSLAWGDGRWVAVGALGGADATFSIYGNADATVATSADGVNWTTVTDGVPNFVNWKSVTYGNGQFVAVGGLALTKAQTWRLSDNSIRVVIPASQISSPKVGTVSLNTEDATYGLVMTSPDGLHWTARSSSHLANWQSVTYGMYDLTKHVYMAVNDSYAQPAGSSEVAQLIVKLNRLLRDAIQNRAIYENFPDLTIGSITDVYIIQAVNHVLFVLENNYEFWLDLIAQTRAELFARAAELSEQEYARFANVMNTVTPFDLQEGSLDRIAELLGGGNVYDNLAEGYLTRQAMYSYDAITWTAMDTVPGTYTSVAFGADWFMAVADTNPYRSTYSVGQVMQSYCGRPWANAMGARHGQPPPLARGWKAVTSGRGRFVAVGNAELGSTNKNPNDVRYGLSQKVYRTALDDLVMTCDPFCQPLLPRREESVGVKAVFPVRSDIPFRVVGTAGAAGRRVIRTAALWDVFPTEPLLPSPFPSRITMTARSRWDAEEISGAVAALSDPFDSTYLKGPAPEDPAVTHRIVGNGLQLVATFNDLKNPYGKNIESLRIAVRCSRFSTEYPDYRSPVYVTDSRNQVSPASRDVLHSRAIRIALGQASPLLLQELTDYWYDTYPYADHPQPVPGFEFFEDPESLYQLPGLIPGYEVSPTLFIDVDGLDDVFVYARGQHLNPDHRITTFYSLQFQKRNGTTWSPEDFAKLKATILINNAQYPPPGFEDAPVRIYSLRCEVTYAPDWKKAECDPDRFYRPPWSAHRRASTWDGKVRYVWRLAKEVRARWDVTGTNAVPGQPDSRIRFTP